MIKSPPSTSSSWISNSSSPSSTLSESSNCPSLTLISTRRKPRTPRKRPNQTYNEAAAILSTAYPRIFPIKHLTIKNKPSHFTKSLLQNTSDLLLHCQVTDDSGFLAHHQRSNFSAGLKGLNLNPFEKTCQSPGEINFTGNNISELVFDFDTESIILDEEIGEGIDCIMGNFKDFNNCNNDNTMMQMDYQFCYGYPVRVGFDEFGQYGMRKEMMRAIRNVDEGDWWRFPSVNVFDLNPKVGENVVDDDNNSNNKKKKRKKKEVVGIKNLELKKENLGVEGGGSEEFVSRTNRGLFLKLNYDGVLNAWSDKGSPFSGECASAEVAGNDVQARLAQIELFTDNGGIREASLQRYKEKKRNRLLSKKIRYQVRKVNADRRPRIKGRFARTPNSSND